jgi:PncC family amidohydrolase
MRPLARSGKDPEERLFKALLRKKLTLALAESCTGGLVSGRITDVPGTSRVLKGCVVAYSNEIKTSLLGVSASTIKKYGAVSPDTAREMAEGARLLMKADVGAAITGIAGPSGASREKPVGLAFIAFSDKKKTIVEKIICRGKRTVVKEKFADALLDLTAGNV